MKNIELILEGDRRELVLPPMLRKVDSTGRIHLGRDYAGKDILAIIAYPCEADKPKYTKVQKSEYNPLIPLKLHLSNLLDNIFLNVDDSYLPARFALAGLDGPYASDLEFIERVKDDLDRFAITEAQNEEELLGNVSSATLVDELLEFYKSESGQLVLEIFEIDVVNRDINRARKLIFIVVSEYLGVRGVFKRKIGWAEYATDS